MAVTAREIIMVFRGQNYLSGAIRRVGTDVAGLTRRQQMQIQRGAIAAAQNRAALTRKAAAAELASVQMGGARYIAAQKAVESAQLTVSRTRNQIAAHEGTLDSARIQRVNTWMARNKAIAAADVAFATHNQAIKNESIKLTGKQSDVEKKASMDRIKGYQAQIRNAQINKAQAERAYSNATRNVAVQRQYGRLLQEQVGIQTTGVSRAIASQKQLAEVEKIKQLRYAETGRALALQNIQLAQADAMLATRRWQGFQQGARWVEHATRVVQMFGLIAGATFGYAAKTAADFNTQMIIAATQSTVAGQNTVAQVQKNAKVVGAAITDLMMKGKTIASSQELGQGIYDIFSGVTLKGNQQAQLKGGISLLKQFNDVLTANAGMVKFDEVVQAGITILNDFNVPLKDMPKNLNLMQAAVRYGRMTMSEFLSTFNQAAPAAKSAGYSFRDMADAITFLSRKFPSIRFAATGYARLVDILGRSREKFAAHDLAITQSNGKLLPLEKIIAKIAARYPKVTTGAKAFASVLKEITGMSGTMQASRVATFLLQDQQGFHRLSQQVNSDNNELTKSLKAAQQSQGVTWAEFVNQMRAVILQIGNEAMPAFQKMGKYVVDAVHWFDNLDPKWKHMIGYMGSIVSIGALVGATIISIAAGFAALASGIFIWAKLRMAMRNAWVTNSALLALNEKTVATNGALMASEAGFVTLQKALFLGILGGLPLLIMYHKQIGQIVNAMGGWRNVVILLAGAFAALNMGRIVTGLFAMNVAMKGLLGAGGLALLIAAMTNFAGASEGVRKVLDYLFSGWAGYIATTVALAAAVNQVTKALMLLGITTKAQALWSGLTGIGATLAGLPRAIRYSRNRLPGGLFGMTESGQMGRIVTTRAGTQMIQGGALQGGRFLGKASVAIGETTAASTGLGASLGGLKGALAGFLPMLVAGGALMGGLYLWKRHLDSIHAAQERVRRTQAYINEVTSSDKLVARYRGYAGTLADVERAQIAYNDALKAYNTAVQQGAKGDDLRTAALNLSDALTALRTATMKANSSLSAFRQIVSKHEKGLEKVDLLKRNIDNLKEFISLYGKLPSTSLSVKAVGSQQMLSDAEYKRFKYIADLFGINDLADARKKLEQRQKMLEDAGKNISRGARQYVFGIQNVLRDLAGMKLLPTANTNVLNQVARWISTLKVPPSLARIRLRMRAAIGLDPNSIHHIPKQYMDAMIRIYNIIENTNRKLTKPQIKLLIRVMLGIDPNSKVGQQLQLIINSVVAGLRANLPAATEAAASAFHHRDAFPVTMPKEPPPAPTAKQRAAAAQATRLSDERKMWNQIQEITKLHQRATTTGSYRDWQAYYKKLNDAQKSWKDTNLDVFNAMLDAQESSLSNSADKQVTTLQDMLSSVKGIYDNFLSQEQNIFGQIGQGPLMTSPMQQFRLQWGGKLTGMDYFNDLKKQFTSFASYHKQLTKMMRSGAPQGLIKEIMGMSPEDGRKMMTALAQLGPQQLREYYNMYNKRQRIIEEYTKKDLKRQLDIYRKHGQNIAKAIINGIQDENVALTKWMKNLITTIFPGLPINDTTKNGPPPPPPPPPKDVPKKDKKPSKVTTTGKPAAPIQHNETHTYHITTTGDPISVKNQIRHADVARRNRYTGRGPGPR